MPIFKSNKNIFVDNGEYFESKWMAQDTIYWPPTKPWSYERELNIDDIDLWEVIYEGNFGIYAAYSPEAEFYMIFPFYWMASKGFKIETFYGKDASIRTWKRAKELDIDLSVIEYWLDSDEYEKYIKA